MNGTGRMFAAGVIVAVTGTVYLTGAKWISGRSGRGGGPKRRLTRPPAAGRRAPGGWSTDHRGGFFAVI